VFLKLLLWPNQKFGTYLTRLLICSFATHNIPFSIIYVKCSTHLLLLSALSGALYVTPLSVCLCLCLCVNDNRRNSTMAVAELRQTIRDSITPFLQGGWRPDEHDHDLYAIHLMDKPGKEAILEIPRVINLTHAHITTQ
jgi:hypothetical protein